MAKDEEVASFINHGPAACDVVAIAAPAATTPTLPAGPANQRADATPSAEPIRRVAPASQVAG